MFPVPELAELAHEQGALFHCDAVQVVGKIPMALSQTRIDMLSCSAHKFHGPKGVGCLWLRRGTRFRPLLRGGHQAHGRRAGTENISGIVGWAPPASRRRSTSRAWRRLASCAIVLNSISSAIPAVTVMGGSQPRVPGTLNLAFECIIEGEAILLLMNQAGIAASSGSACTSGSLEPSHVMRAMNIPYTAAHGTVPLLPLALYPGKRDRLRHRRPASGYRPAARPVALLATRVSRSCRMAPSRRSTVKTGRQQWDAY